jgi:hypothetical protein
MAFSVHRVVPLGRRERPVRDTVVTKQGSSFRRVRPVRRERWDVNGWLCGCRGRSGVFRPVGRSELPLAFGRTYPYLGGFWPVDRLAWTVTGERESRDSVDPYAPATSTGRFRRDVGSYQMTRRQGVPVPVGRRLPTASWTVTGEGSRLGYPWPRRAMSTATAFGRRRCARCQQRHGQSVPVPRWASGFRSIMSWTGFGEAPTIASLRRAGDDHKPTAARRRPAVRFLSFGGKAYLYLGGARRGLCHVVPWFDLSTLLSLGRCCERIEFRPRPDASDPRGV